MARYYLVSWFPRDGETEKDAEEDLGQRKKTKADVEKWIEDNTRALGLDWRAGYTLKFRKGSAVYQWRWIKDGSPLKP